MIPILDTHYNAKIHKKWELLSGSCPQPEISNLEDVSCSHHADMGGHGGRGCISPPHPHVHRLGQRQEILLGEILVTFGTEVQARELASPDT